jgi:serine/threonine protein kinase
MAVPASSLQHSIRWPASKVVIGRGAFGEVTEAFDTNSGCVVAVKTLALKERDGTDISREKVANLVAEIALMKKLTHPNIVKYIGAYRSTEELCIVMEYIAAGSVSKVIGRYGKLPENVVRLYTKDMIRGLSYLHANKVAHRDLKCENLLLCSTGVVKLSDFGCSKEIVGDTGVTQTLTGTPLFMAPEVALNKGAYDPFSADMWTAGITIIEMLAGEPPFAKRFRQPVEAILHVAQTNELPPVPEDVSESCRDFLLRCIVRDPAGRATASELLTHPFIAPRDLDTRPQSPEQPGNGFMRPVAPMTPRPNSADRPGSRNIGTPMPRPPSAQRVSPGLDETLPRTVNMSRPSSGNPFPGRHLPARPGSTDLPVQRPGSGELLRPLMPLGPSTSMMTPHSPRAIVSAASPRRHHLPAMSESLNEHDADSLSHALSSDVLKP